MARNRYLIPCLLCALTGCSGKSGDTLPRAAVRGMVTFDGEPLPEGVIRFLPQAGTPGPKTSAPVANGEFALPERSGPPVGTHRVEIVAAEPAVPPDDEETITRLKTTGERVNVTVLRIPPVYNVKSRLQQEVTADGPNEFRFDLVSRPAASKGAATGSSR